MSGDCRAPISSFMLELEANKPRSANALASSDDEPPFEASLMRMDAERVYTLGVVSKYHTAAPRHTARDMTNQCHLERQR